MYIWYDDRFTQMKRSNAHEVTLRAVLGNMQNMQDSYLNSVFAA